MRARCRYNRRCESRSHSGFAILVRYPSFSRTNLIYPDPTSRDLVKQRETLTAAEVRALVDYSQWSQPLNEALAAGCLSARQADHVRALDGATRKWQLTTPAVLYHGTRLDVVQRYEDGEPNRGFLSTTTRRSVALRYAEGGLLRIWCEAGTRVADLDAEQLLSNNEDSELLLGRGAQFRILDLATVQSRTPPPLERADALIRVVNLELRGFEPASYVVAP